MNTLELIEKWTKTYQEKNRDSGDSWKKTGQLIDIIVGQNIQLDTVEKKNAAALMVRILDKLCRFGNLYFNHKSESVVRDESIRDTLCDAGIYMFMLAELVDHPFADPEKEAELKQQLRDILIGGRTPR